MNPDIYFDKFLLLPLIASEPWEETAADEELKVKYLNLCCHNYFLWHSRRDITATATHKSVAYIESLWSQACQVNNSMLSILLLWKTLGINAMDTNNSYNQGIVYYQKGEYDRACEDAPKA